MRDLILGAIIIATTAIAILSVKQKMEIARLNDESSAVKEKLSAIEKRIDSVKVIAEETKANTDTLKAGQTAIYNAITEQQTPHSFWRDLLKYLE